MYLYKLDSVTSEFILRLISFLKSIKTLRYDIIIKQLNSISNGGDSERILNILRETYSFLNKINANLFENQKKKLLQEMITVAFRFKTIIKEIESLDEKDIQIIKDCIKKKKNIDIYINVLEDLKERIDQLVFTIKFEDKLNRLKKIKEIENKYSISLFDFSTFYQEKKAMNWYKRILAAVKKCYIMRGLPGSGKSTLAQELGRGGMVFSSDDYFMVDGEYRFDINKIDEAHAWNEQRAEEAMKKGISPIVIDNTNVQAWQPKKNVENAKKYGYNIEIREPNTAWKFDVDELAKRNKHGVPKDVIQDMVNKLEKYDIEDILKAEKPEKINN